MTKKVLFLIGIVAIVSGCASTRQYVKFPDQSVDLEDPAKARIYVARPTSFGGAVSMTVSDGDIVIGKTGPKGYLCWERNPGEMTLTGKAENADLEKMSIQQGYVYYFEQKVKMGILMARNDIIQVEGEEGRKIVSKCKPPKVETD